MGSGYLISCKPPHLCQRLSPPPLPHRPVTRHRASGLAALPPHTFSGFSVLRGKLGCKAHKESAHTESVGDTKVLAPEAAHLPEQGPAHQPSDPEAPRCCRHGQSPRPTGLRSTRCPPRDTYPASPEPRTWRAQGSRTTRCRALAARSRPRRCPIRAAAPPPRRWRYWLQRSGGRGFPGRGCSSPPRLREVAQGSCLLSPGFGLGAGFSRVSAKGLSQWIWVGRGIIFDICIVLFAVSRSDHLNRTNVGSNSDPITTYEVLYQSFYGSFIFLNFELDIISST